MSTPATTIDVSATTRSTAPLIAIVSVTAAAAHFMVRHTFQCPGENRPLRVASASVAANRGFSLLALVGVTALLGGLGIVGLLLGQSSATDLNADGRVMVVDSFRRPGAWTPLKVPGSSFQSEPLMGDWYVERGNARVRWASYTFFALAALDAPEEARVISSSFASVGESCGLAFRVQDIQNFWAVIAKPESATWNIVKMRDGNLKFAANTGLTLLGAGSQVTILDHGDSFEVLTARGLEPGQSSVRVSDNFLGEEHRGGLIALDKGCETTRWKSFAYGS